LCAGIKNGHTSTAILFHLQSNRRKNEQKAHGLRLKVAAEVVEKTQKEYKTYRFCGVGEPRYVPARPILGDEIIVF